MPASDGDENGNGSGNGNGNGSESHEANVRTSLLGAAGVRCESEGGQMRDEIERHGNGNGIGGRLGYGGVDDDGNGIGDKSGVKHRKVFDSEEGSVSEGLGEVDIDVDMEDGYKGDGEDEADDGIEDENEGRGGGHGEVKQRVGLLFPAVALGILLSAADQTIIVSSYGKIGSDLNALNNTSWIATAYLLTLTSFQPLYGKLSDIFGRKPALMFAYLVFGTGCLFCGLARNLEELVAARAFAGIGGGGMSTVVSILFSDIVALRDRGTWQGYMNVVYALGASMGAPLGGILSDSIGWRWAFIGQFPLTLVACTTVYLVLDLPASISQTHWLSKLRKIDFLGALTLISAVFCLLVGLDRGSNVSWLDSYTLLFCLTSLPLFGIFVFVEMRIAEHPFAPGHIIFQRSLLASYMCNFFVLAAHMGSIFYIPLYFQAVDGMSATSAGMRLIPGMVCSVIGSLFGGKVMQRTGRYYWLTVWCLGVSVAGSLVVLSSSGVLITSSWGIACGLGLLAFGGGAAVTTTLINVIANAAPEDQAIATAGTYLFRSLGSVVGVSIAATVVQQALRSQLQQKLNSGDADEIVEKVRQSLDFIKTLEPATRELVRECYQRATSAAFAVSAGLVIASLVAAAGIRERRLSR